MEIQRTVKEMCYRIDPEFKHKVLHVPGGETLKLCYQCGTCTATCPISRFTDIYRPNKIIHLAKLGIKNVFSDAVWFCVACYSCTERCPQGVKVADVMRALKNLAVKEGYCPTFAKGFATNILNTGLAYSIPSSRITKRVTCGLPPLPQTNTEDLKILADIVEFSKLTNE
ncbi:MAG: 4Fe-4S dicluster domain-containing protein [Candidatus Bathyarchaeota archaeon]